MSKNKNLDATGRQVLIMTQTSINKSHGKTLKEIFEKAARSFYRVRDGISGLCRSREIIKRLLRFLWPPKEHKS